VRERDIPIISLSNIVEKDQFLDFNGRAIISEEILSLNIARTVIQRFFNGKSSLRLESTFGAILEDFNTAKITGFLNSGYYSDLITNDAFEKGYNLIHLKNYIVTSLSYLGYLRQSGICHFPFEIHYGSNEAGYVVQMIVPAENYIIEYVKKSLKTEQDKEPVHTFNFSYLRSSRSF
jgi:hypothetical protein